MAPVMWESVAHNEWRARVVGGWLYKVTYELPQPAIHITTGMHTNPMTTEYNEGMSITFIPDPEHQWDQIWNNMQQLDNIIEGK